MKLVVRNETGTGRACVCITVPGFSAAVEGAIVQELSKTEKVLVIEVQGNLHGQWREALDQLREILAERRVRNASYVGIAAGSSLALQQAIENSKEVRRLSVIDGTTRPQPTWYEKCVDSLESKLPLGLPFRRKSELFDAKPYLQRVRCPVLVMSTPFGSMYTRAEAERMLDRFPSAWFVQVQQHGLANEIEAAIRIFLALDPKCPQKGAALAKKQAMAAQ